MRTLKMTPAEAGSALLASAEAVHEYVLALAEGRLAPPKQTRAGWRRFAPHFDRTKRRGIPYTTAWLCKQIRSQYPSHNGQPSRWIIAGLQFNINVERGLWRRDEIEKAARGEHGFTCNALVLQYQKESRARLKYVRRGQKNRKKKVARQAFGFGHRIQ